MLSRAPWPRCWRRGREGRWGPFPPRPSASALWTSWRQIPLLRLAGSPVTPSGPGGPSVCLPSLFTFLVDFGRCFIYEPSSFSRRQGTGFSAESSGLRVCEALPSLPRAPFLARSRAQCPSHPFALAPAPASLARVSGSLVSPPWVCPLTGVAVKPRPSLASSLALVFTCPAFGSLSAVSRRSVSRHPQRSRRAATRAPRVRGSVNSGERVGLCGSCSPGPLPATLGGALGGVGRWSRERLGCLRAGVHVSDIFGLIRSLVS